MTAKGTRKLQPKEAAAGIVGWIAIIGGVWFWLSRPDETHQTSVDPVEAAIAALASMPVPELTAEQRAEKEHEKLYGQNCLSGWDGSHRKFVELVKGRLNDPDSFEHDETKTWPVRADGQNQILMQFRAKNGFGGIIRGRAIGTFDNETCEPKVDVIE